ncbi:MAG: S41 family peptidase [Isosphaeraceae bacterium]
MPRRNLTAIAMVAALTVFSWQALQGAKPKDEMMELYGLFVDAVEQVETNYVRPVDRRALLESALKGMLQDLDPHSQFITEAEWKSFRKQIEGRYGGIGIQVEIDPDAERLRVIAPMVGTPAYQAGVLPGDVILEIDGQSTEGMSPDRAVEVLTGRIGTEVSLRVKHEGDNKLETLKMHRAVIDVPSVLGDHRKADDTWDYMLDPEKKIGYIRISSFIQNTAEELKHALSELKAQGMKGLILDLRDNPGGLLSAAVEISDLFIDSGKIVSTKGRNTPTKTYEAQKDGMYTDFPMAVLVNGGSASAAEIVSACLQDHKRAKVVGQRSFGKGSVQNILELEDGTSVLKLTVATYMRPSGKNIHRFKNAKDEDEWGVSPDKGLEVKLTPEQYFNFARGRRQRDLLSSRRRKPAETETAKAAEVKKDEPKKEADTKKDGEVKPEEKGKEQAKADVAKPKADTSPRATSRPFVDTQRDKAFQVILEELSEQLKKKAA